MGSPAGLSLGAHTPCLLRNLSSVLPSLRFLNLQEASAQRKVETAVSQFGRDPLEQICHH